MSLLLASAPCLINSSTTALLLFLADIWSGALPLYNIWMRLMSILDISNRLINIHNIYDKISYHRLLSKYQIDNIVIIVMRLRCMRYWNRRRAYIVFNINISSMSYQ